MRGSRDVVLFVSVVDRKNSLNDKIQRDHFLSRHSIIAIMPATKAPAILTHCGTS